MSAKPVCRPIYKQGTETPTKHKRHYKQHTRKRTTIYGWSRGERLEERDQGGKRVEVMSPEVKISNLVYQARLV